MSPRTSKEDLARVASEVAAAVATLAQAGDGPFDLTYASLDRVEDRYRLGLEGKPGAADQAQLAYYLGETLRHQTGAKWDLDKDGNPCLRGLPELPSSFRFQPSKVLAEFKRGRVVGGVRQGVEPLDLPHMRAWLPGWVATLAAEQRALEATPWVSEAKVGPLDQGDASIDGVQRALVLALEHKVSRDERRRLQSQVAGYLGEILRARRGGEWTLDVDPSSVDFGLPSILGWAPATPVMNLAGIARPPEFLRRALGAWIENLDQRAARRK